MPKTRSPSLGHVGDKGKYRLIGRGISSGILRQSITRANEFAMGKLRRNRVEAVHRFSIEKAVGAGDSRQIGKCW